MKLASPDLFSPLAQLPFRRLFVARTMALVGSLVGLLLVAGVQHFCSTPRAPIVIPWWLSLGSCLLVLVICLISSWLPYLRIRKVDPLMVLQS